MALNILLPLDGSPFSEQVLSFAGGLARAADIVLHLVKVHRTITPIGTRNPVSVGTEWEQRLGEQEYLDQIARSLHDEATCSVRTAVLQGGVVSALNRYIRDQDIGLVVITTHGHGGLKRAWMGSIADGLVRTSPAPVFLVRPQASGEVLAPKRIDNILIPLDGSALSEQIIEPAFIVGRLFGAHIRLLQVVAPSRLVSPWEFCGSPESQMEAGRQHAAQYIETLAEQLRSRGYVIDTSLILHWNPATAILDASVREIDLIAMATHGRGGWQRVALGSVTDKVQRNTRLPMLLLQPLARLDGRAPTLSASPRQSAAV